MSDLKLSGHELNWMTFPGGEEHLKVTKNKDFFGKEYNVTARINDSLGIVRLMLLMNHLNTQWFKTPIHLNLTYLPYARQDVPRAMEDYGSDMMCELINSFNCATVTVLDPHSEAAVNKIKRCKRISKVNVFELCDLFINLKVGAVVAPDLGATKNGLADLAKGFKVPLLEARKQRDPDTGKLSNIQLMHTGKIEGNVLVADDICDGGGTFIPISDQIDCTGEKILYVTHGIFSKGFTPFKGKYNRIITTDSFRELDEKEAKEQGITLEVISIYKDP